MQLAVVSMDHLSQLFYSAMTQYSCGTYAG